MSLSRVVLGMQSFRCSEALIGGLYGVAFTRIGYTGGTKPHPCYLHIGGRYDSDASCIDHTEVVEVNYNKRIISLSDILRVFFENHDYTMPLPRRYASSIFFTESAQYDEALAFMRTRLVMDGNARDYQSKDVVTRLSPLQDYHDAEHMFHKYYLQNTPTVMLQLLYEYNWDWKTWFSEFNVLPFVTKLNAALSGFFSPEYVLRILDSINVPDNIKRECKLRASHTHPRCLLM